MEEPTMTDEEILLKCDTRVRPRVRMELKIVNQLIKSAKAYGYTLKEAQAEDEGDFDYDIKDMIFNLDEAKIMVYKEDKYIGWIHLVLGNDGYDLISDYSMNLEGFLATCNELADKLENGLA
jgi:hypothetical protein